MYIVPDFIVPDFIVPDFIVPDFIVPDFIVPDFIVPDFIVPAVAFLLPTYREYTCFSLYCTHHVLYTQVLLVMHC